MNIIFDVEQSNKICTRNKQSIEQNFEISFKKYKVQRPAQVWSPGSVNHGEIFMFSCLQQVKVTQVFHHDSPNLGSILLLVLVYHDLESIMFTCSCYLVIQSSNRGLLPGGEMSSEAESVKLIVKQASHPPFKTTTAAATCTRDDDFDPSRRQ